MPKKENIEDGVEMSGSVKNSSPAPRPKATGNSELDDLRQEIQILRESVREDKLKQADSKYKPVEPSLPVGFLKRLHGELVVKWMGVNEEGSKAKQELHYQGQAVVGEHLNGHYITIDDKEIVCDSIEFTRSNDIEKFSKVDGYGEDWVIEFHNPELAKKYPEYKINTKFINP